MLKDGALAIADAAAIAGVRMTTACRQERRLKAAINP
jgi:hypothetical protein